MAAESLNVDMHCTAFDSLVIPDGSFTELLHVAVLYRI